MNIVGAIASNFTFGLAGVLMLFFALQGFMKPQTAMQPPGIPLAFGIIFTSVNMAITFLTMRSLRQSANIAKLRATHPSAPWMWRSEWQSGRIAEHGGRGLFWLWAFTILWNGATLPLLFSVTRDVAKGSTGALILLVFPLAGFVLLYGSIVGSLRRRRFGSSSLVLTTNPAPIGGKFSGHIETVVARDVFSNAKIDATLACVERVRSVGRNSSSTREQVLWQETLRITPSKIVAGAHGATIPVTCSIPSGLRPSTVEDDSRMIVWRLMVDAKMPGADYSAAFELPAFET